MPEKKTATKSTQKSPKTTSVSGKSSKGLTDDERAAMKARLQELKTEERANKNRAEGERAAVAAIEAMTEPDRTMARRIHAIVGEAAPDLWPKTWYGMPAYARDGKVVCFFKAAEKFNSRYATFGFEEAANLDDGAMWPTSYALTKLTAADVAKLSALVKRAAS
jgi:uncharacterized protein YdhG (YjbR/CyaY superfamily)